MTSFPDGSLPPLPAELAAAFEAALAATGKRERTRAQLLRAAVQVFGEAGVAAASVQRIARAAGVTAATFYNHFATREALLEGLAVTMAGSLGQAILESYRHIDDGARRMAIGQRRYVWLAARAPGWALLFMDVIAAHPDAIQDAQAYALADLRLGVRQKRFRIASEAAAMDAVNGVCMQAMRRVALGEARARHDIACAATVLRALGMPPEEADEVARLPLPPLPSPASAARA